MSHSIYTGSFEALERRWIDLITGLQNEDPLREINVLIGSNILATYLKHRLAENVRTVANVRFHTFLDLTERLASTSGPGRKKTRLPRMGASVILEAILNDNPPQIYSELSGYRGFRDSLLDTFRDLRDAGIGPDELDKSIRKKNNTKDRNEQLSGFADLYRRYRGEAILFADVDDDFRAAVGNASQAGKILGMKRLLIYGIYDATGQQSLLLTALLNSIDMIYFIPFVDETVSDFARPFLKNRVKELGIEIIHLQDRAPSSSLGRIASCNFGLSGKRRSGERLDPDGSFTLISAPGESRSAVEIVREIFRAVHDKTIAGFHESAVIVRQPESDIPIIAEMFRLRGVPSFIHGGKSFAESSLGRAVMALGRLESTDFSREAVLNAMELAAAALPEEAAAEWNVQSWRTLLSKSEFLGGLHAWNSEIETLVETARREREEAEFNKRSSEEEEGVRIRPVHSAVSRLNAALSLRNGWLVIRYASADWSASLSWQDWADFLDGHLAPLLGLSEDWNTFLAVLDELRSLQSLNDPEAGNLLIKKTAKIPADSLRAALSDALSSQAIVVGRFQRSGVNILSTGAARGLRFPLVIIPGLDEGRFPARLRQDPLLLDAERSWIDALPVKSKRIDEEKLLFDMAARSAEKRLVLLTSRLDESSDREKIPSQFLLRFASAARGSSVTIRDLAQGLVPGFRSVSLDNPAPPEGEIPVDEGEIRLRLILAERETARTALQSLAQLEPLRLGRPLEYDRARWARKLTAFDGCISDPPLVEWTAQRIGISAGQVSASRIEEFVKCPYAFFLKRAMDLQAWEEPSKIEGMDPLERGTAIHSILENFLKDNGEEIFRSASSEKLRDLLHRQAYDALEKARPEGLPDLLWEIERDTLIGMLNGWLEFERKRAGDDMRIVRLEQVFGAFGPEEQFPAFSLKAGIHTFDFRGRIDRIDLSPDGKRARVIDYKTGTLPDAMANKNSRNPLMSGEKIQLVLYRGALSVLEEYRKIETVEGEYLHLQPKDGRTVPCSFNNEELAEAAQALPQILEAVGNGIASGAFFIRTSGKLWPYGHCNFCDFLSLCGKDRVQREERKMNDPAVQRFFRAIACS
jgi:ATP-dependent helicase/nuclease subunit B